MLIVQVALVSDTKKVKPSELTRVGAALQKQAVRDFAPIWEVRATVDPFVQLEDVPIGYWPIIVRDDIQVEGAAGIHLDNDGQPFALVQYDDGWSLTASHECLEMLGDPYGNRLIAGNSVKKGQGRVEYLVEVCDPSRSGISRPSCATFGGWDQFPGRGHGSMTHGTRPGPPRRTPLTASPGAPGENPLRAGMPMLDTIHSRETLASPKPAGRTYRVIRTTEVDAYEVEGAPERAVLSRAVLLAAPVGDKFKGTSRKAAKISISTASTETFGDLVDLVASLEADEDMIDKKPRISTKATSNRVKSEKRNVAVRAFLYAASRESDNDFHLIVGRDPDLTPELYMTMELSGLPPASSKSHKRLKAARDAYKDFFGDQLPGLTYDFYDPPIPLEVEGSLFFDMSHAAGQRPGPQSLKSRMPTIWEVHPISRIDLEP